MMYVFTLFAIITRGINNTFIHNPASGNIITQYSVFHAWSNLEYVNLCQGFMSLLSTNNYWTGSVVNNVITHTAHDGASHLSQTTCSHDNHGGSFLLSNFTDDLSGFVASFWSHPSRYLPKTSSSVCWKVCFSDLNNQNSLLIVHDDWKDLFHLLPNKITNFM